MRTARDLYGEVSDTPAMAASLPAAAYLEDQVFDDEVTHVFKKGWLPVARISEVASPGDYRTADLFGEALVVTCDEDRQIHVLSRICPHRAMPVIEGTGNTTALTCPYHVWRYRLDGSFLSAPAMGKSELFDPEKCSLPSIRHEIWNGWVFVNLSGDADPLAPQLEPLTDRLAPLNPSEMVSVGYLEFSSSWNWKIMVENFLESYHHIGTHSSTLEQTNPGLGTYCADMKGPFAVLENPPKSDEDDPFVVACVFPLAMMFFLEGPFQMGGWYEFCDIKKDHFVLRIHVLLHKDVSDDAETIALAKESLQTIHLEDIPFCEGVQKGLRSSDYRPGPLSHLEKCNWRFHQFLRECFTGDASPER